MILPKTNISIIDVRNALNYPSTDLGTLCSVGSPYVNMWARYKPVRAAFTYNRPADWWRGDENDCGINTDSFNSLSGLLAYGKGFTYKAPRGGQNEPFRLGDFANYDSNALAPIYYQEIPSEIYSDSQSYIPIRITNLNAGGLNLTLSELGDASESYYVCYAGVAVQRQDGSDSIRMITTNVRVDVADDYTINVPTNAFTLNVPYNFTIFFCNFTQTTLGVPPVNAQVYLPSPSTITTRTVTVKQGGVTVTLDASCSTNGIISYSINVVNSLATGTATLTNLKLYWLYRNSNFPLQSNEFRSGEGFTDIIVNGQTQINVPVTSAPTNISGTMPLSGKLMDYERYAAKLIFEYYRLGVRYWIESDLPIPTQS